MDKQQNDAAFSGTSSTSGSASVYVQHERWMADRWKVMFQVDGAVRMKFMIGAECSTKKEAERLRDDFENALCMIGINLPNKRI